MVAKWWGQVYARVNIPGGRPHFTTVELIARRGNLCAGVVSGILGAPLLSDTKEIMMTTPWNQDKYIAALRFAAEAHTGAVVPGTAIPYIVHPVQVAMEVMAAVVAERVADADLAVQCALLHDVLEDTPTPFSALEAVFGGAVASGVAALSKNEALPSAESMRDSLDRIIREPREVWLVKLADRISNLMPPPPHWTAQKCATYQTEARLILDVLGAASPFLAARLAQKIATYSLFTK